MTDSAALDTAVMKFFLRKQYLNVDLNEDNQGKNIRGKESSQCPDCAWCTPRLVRRLLVWNTVIMRYSER